MEQKQVKISDCIQLLKTGYTRWESDAVETGKSIEHQYGLSTSEAKTLFAHPKLKRLKTIFQTLQIIDDTEDETPLVLSIDDSIRAANTTLVSSATASTGFNVVGNVGSPQALLPKEESGNETLDIFL
jgi:hypothetical protein